MGELVISGLTAGYGSVPVLWDVDLRVPTVGIVSLLGANGAGKSTLLRAITGIARIRSGDVSWNEKDIEGKSPHRIAAMGIAHVPEGRGIFAELTVEENLRLGTYSRHVGRKGRREYLEDRDGVFTLFPRLSERKSQKAGSLSGGEQQMLAIGRALIARPELIMLDEPSLGLSPKFVDEVFDRLLQLAATQSILLVEQNARAALAISSYAYVLSMGKIATHGTPSAVTNSESIHRAYLGIT